MLKIGYGLILVAGVGLLGYVGYRAAVWLLRPPGLGLFLKGTILCGAAGIGLTLLGLAMERRKESKHDPRIDESD